MLDVFRPNRRVSGRAWSFLLATEIVTLLILWSFGDAYLIPGPIEIAKAWVRLVQEEGLLHELIVSFQVNAEALVISTAVSLVLSYSTVLPFMRPIVGALSNVRFFGLTGFMVVIIMIVGGGEKLKLSLLVFGMCPYFITSMVSTIRCIPKSQYDQARSLRMKDWRTVREVVIYGTADQAFEILSSNAAIGWMMLGVVEGQNRSGGGIGAMMLNQDKHRMLANVFAIQATIFIFGILQDKSLSVIKRLVCPGSEIVLEKR